MKQKRGIFISYRRSTGSTLARMIYDRLRFEMKYQCFLDVKELDAGNFRKQIREKMDNCDIFLLVLSKDALDRCSEPNDNVLQEILAAKEKQLSIIPVTAVDFEWPGNLPDDIKDIPDYNAIPDDQVYADSLYKRLYEFIETDREKRLGWKGVIRRFFRKLREHRKYIIIGAAFALLLVAAADFIGRGKNTAEKETTAAAETSSVQAAETVPAETAAVQAVETAQAKASETVPAKTSETVPAAPSVAEFTAASSQPDAPELPLSVKVRGEYTRGDAWACFTTGAEEGAKYYVTMQNLTPGSKKLTGRVCDVFGRVQEATSFNNNPSWMDVESDGASRFMMFDFLKPETTYYVKIEGNGKAEYSLAVSKEGEENVICAPKEEIKDEADYCAAPNQDAAPLLTISKKYRGSYESGYAWNSFRTGKEEDVKYYVTVQNLTPGSNRLVGRVYDEYGTVQEASADNNHSLWIDVESDGATRFMMFDHLKPETTYYVMIEGGKAEYSLAVSKEGEENAICAPKEEIAEEADYHTAPNQDAAPILEINQKYKGNYESGYSWISFRTGNEEGAEYYVTMRNLTPGSSRLVGRVYDEYGTVQEASSYNDNALWMDVESDGTPRFMMFDYLKPETIYYVMIEGGKAEYKISVSDEQF